MKTDKRHGCYKRDKKEISWCMCKFSQLQRRASETKQHNCKMMPSCSSSSRRRFRGWRASLFPFTHIPWMSCFDLITVLAPSWSGNERKKRLSQRLSCKLSTFSLHRKWRRLLQWTDRKRAPDEQMSVQIIISWENIPDDDLSLPVLFLTEMVSWKGHLLAVNS